MSTTTSDDQLAEIRRRIARLQVLAQTGLVAERARIQRHLDALHQEEASILAAVRRAPDEVEEAFVKANPGLPRDAIAVTCDSRRLGEVRICIGKDFRFRSCPETDARACRREQVVMPPVRGGSARRALSMISRACAGIGGLTGSQ